MTGFVLLLQVEWPRAGRTLAQDIPLRRIYPCAGHNCIRLPERRLNAQTSLGLFYDRRIATTGFWLQPMASKKAPIHVGSCEFCERNASVEHIGMAGEFG